MLYCNNNSVNSKFNIPCNQWEVLDISRKCFDITGYLLTLDEFVPGFSLPLSSGPELRLYFLSYHLPTYDGK